jgi:hypothetical protein
MPSRIKLVVDSSDFLVGDDLLKRMLLSGATVREYSAETQALQHT